MNTRVLDLFFPPQCGGCGCSGTGLCESCVPSGARIVRTLAGFDVRALALYAGGMRRAVYALKDGRRDVAQAFGERLAPMIGAEDLLVPVPTTAARRRVRGIDGVVVMARAAARASGASTLEGLHCTTGDRQRGKNREERLASFGRFECSSVLAGCSVVLVDDVCTTGTTLVDCAAAVRSSGGTVRFAVVAALVDNSHESGFAGRSAPG